MPDSVVIPDSIVTPGGIVTKVELRALGLARRSQMAEAERRAASIDATARLVGLVRPGETVSIFWPMRSEIDPRGLIDTVTAAGGTIALPVVEKRNMFFRAFAGEDCLEDGGFGTRHPNPAQPSVHPDLIVAPLAAFDRRGGRIGYGAGYYDQAIAELRAEGRAVRVAGIAFSCQEVEAVPVEPHDIPLERVATERELIETPTAAGTAMGAA